jgi:hypothetical protein
VGKRKREDDMAALEAAVAASSVSATRLPGFVSGGTVQPDQRTTAGLDDAAAAAGDPSVSPNFLGF